MVGQRERPGASRRGVDDRLRGDRHPRPLGRTRSARSSTRPTRSSSRTTANNTLTAATPAGRRARRPARTCRSSASPRTRPTRPSARRSPSPSRCNNRGIAGARRDHGHPADASAAPRSTPTPPSIAAGATATVADQRHLDRRPAAGPPSPPPPTRPNVVAETNENNNTLSQSIVVGRGAAVPYIVVRGRGRHLPGHPAARPTRCAPSGTPTSRTESSGRQSVRLNSTGPVRASSPRPTPPTRSWCATPIPDAAGGGGQDATISLYVNGTFVQKLTLSSRHSWLYGTTDEHRGLSNTPGGRRPPAVRRVARAARRSRTRRARGSSCSATPATRRRSTSST